VASVKACRPGKDLFLAQTARQVTDLDHVITGGCKSDMDGMPYYWFPPEEILTSP
jgi:hypothetical protein